MPLAAISAAFAMRKAMATLSGFGRGGRSLLGLDVGQRRLDRIEHQKGGGVPGLVVLDRLEHGQVGPPPGGRRPTLLEHPAHGAAHLAQLLRTGATILRPMTEAAAWPSRQAL